MQMPQKNKQGRVPSFYCINPRVHFDPLGCLLGKIHVIVYGDKPIKCCHSCQRECPIMTNGLYVTTCSGLDSTTAMHLLKTIRALAQGGRAILATIHQPSSRLYWQLDTLMLLSEGHVMYYGCAEMANDWFAHMNFPCTFGVNIADFILDLANGEFWDESRLVSVALSLFSFGIALCLEATWHCRSAP